MNRTEVMERQLRRMADELNEAIGYDKIAYHQQRVSKGNMCLLGANGRLWIQPGPDNTYNVSLSGKSLTAELYPVFRKLFGRDNYGYHQTKPEPHQPFWRTESFDKVRAAAEIYSKTNK